jgi:hypothetical protein
MGTDSLAVRGDATSQRARTYGFTPTEPTQRAPKRRVFLFDVRASG